MQVVAFTPAVNVTPTAVAPLVALGAGVFHQRCSLNSQSSLIMPRPGFRLQPLRAIHAKRRGPVAPRQNLHSFDEGDRLSVLSDVSTSLLTGKLGGLSSSMPFLPKRRCLLPTTRAFDPNEHGYVLHNKFFKKTEKPKWWWRTLSCLPYLLVIHKAWMYAEGSYYTFLFLGSLGFLANPYLSTIGRLPGHVLMAYTIIAYLGVVRRKEEWPYFFRFHVILGMLLDMGLDIFMIVSNWMPLVAFWGKPGMVLWVAINSVYVVAVLECVRCALAGTYADVPFLSVTAYVQTQLQN